jgi:glucose-fructose oxidoreductase
MQPQPKCGFVLVGTKGTISSYDYETTIRVQDATYPEGKVVPVDKIRPPFHNAIAYTVDCLSRGRKPDGPLSPKIARIGQQIVDTAVQSARLRKTVKLIG